MMSLTCYNAKKDHQIHWIDNQYFRLFRFIQIIDYRTPIGSENILESIKLIKRGSMFHQ